MKDYIFYIFYLLILITTKKFIKHTALTDNTL